MEFKKNEGLIFEDKVAQVSKEIKDCYPDLDNEIVIKAASLCDTITNTPSTDAKFSRYYNILCSLKDYNMFTKVLNHMIIDCDKKLTNEVYIDVYNDIIKYYYGEIPTFPSISDYYE